VRHVPDTGSCRRRPATGGVRVARVSASRSAPLCLHMDRLTPANKPAEGAGGAARAARVRSSPVGGVRPNAAPARISLGFSRLAALVGKTLSFHCHADRVPVCGSISWLTNSELPREN